MAIERVTMITITLLIQDKLENGATTNFIAGD